jgi:hypothetical protein
VGILGLPVIKPQPVLRVTSITALLVTTRYLWHDALVCLGDPATPKAICRAETAAISGGTGEEGQRSFEENEGTEQLTQEGVLCSSFRGSFEPMSRADEWPGIARL